MEPPICYVCHRALSHDAAKPDAEDSARLVVFNIDPRDEPNSDGWTGHPSNAGWFCKLHWPTALDLTELTIIQALRQLREEFDS